MLNKINSTFSTCLFTLNVRYPFIIFSHPFLHFQSPLNLSEHCHQMSFLWRLWKY